MRRCAGVDIATKSRSQCRPGFFLVFDLGDHVGAEVGQLREELAIAVWLARHGEGFRAGSFEYLKCLSHREYTSRYLADRYSQYSHSTENGAAPAPHESALNRHRWRSEWKRNVTVCSRGLRHG